MGQLRRLKRSSTTSTCAKYVKGKPSAILSFGVQDGREGGTRFIDALQLFTRLVNIGDAKVWRVTLQPQLTANSTNKN